jgi:hypothetical protein
MRPAAKEVIFRHRESALTIELPIKERNRITPKFVAGREQRFSNDANRNNHWRAKNVLDPLLRCG